MRRPTAMLALVSAAAVGVAAGAPAAAASGHPAVTTRQPTAPDRSTINWGPCTDSDLVKAGARCGLLSVPLDYAHPAGPKIQLAVSRVRHTVSAAGYQGVMLVNPGGPGGSGLGLATLGSAVPHGAGGAYDWIGFDPRGVGSSRPALSCVADYFRYNRPSYIPTTTELRDIWLGRSQRYARACQRAAADLLPHMTTVDAARDMDRIRAALGVRQINYYGFSYGTYLGQVYSTLFPTHVRRMVLDSNVDPRFVFYQANLNQDVALQRTMNAWFAWLARYDGVYHLGSTGLQVGRRVLAERRALVGHPAGGKLGPDELTDTLLVAGYTTAVWTYLADALSSWVNGGDPSGLVQAYGIFNSTTDDNTFAVYNAVQCTDAHWPQDWATWRTDNWRIFPTAKFLTWDNVWFNAPCLYWPAASRTAVDVDGSRVASALLVDETLDAATPYPGSLEVRRRFPHASLIALPGGTNHANSLAGDACLDNQIADYLATGKLPARQPGNRADAYCRPLPLPVPSSATASRAAPAPPRLVDRFGVRLS